jgi:hypothetical protein
MASTYLTLTKSTGSMVQWTWSAWVKRSAVRSTEQNIFTGYNAATDYTEVRFDSSNRLNFQNKVANSIAGELQTTRVFRDPSGWYHIVIIWDTGNATGDDRMRMYINGVRETVFTGTDIPTLNKDSNIGEASIPTHIGSFATGSNFFDGLMSDICFIDGQALAPTSFGETDTDTGEWKPISITASSFTWGTNGYMILKNGSTITDQSSNSNNFTLGAGTLTNTLDCPSNVFATWNPLNEINRSTVGQNEYIDGNTNLDTANNSNQFHGSSTLGMTSGKYYAEFKMKSGAKNLVGITSQAQIDAEQTRYVGFADKTYGLYSNDGSIKTNNVDYTYAASYTTPNVIGCAVDLDNNKIYFSKDGVWATGSGAWGSSTFDSSIGAYVISDVSSTVDGAYFFAMGDTDTLTYGTFSANFGNGYQGTTAVSGGTAGSTPGVFEFDVPSGYQPLSTKGLNA